MMSISCVIVCYSPNPEALHKLCMTLFAQGAVVFLVDNTEEQFLDLESLIPGCRLTRLGFNSGIAHALNIGIQSALKEGADVIALFDQDSLIDANFLSALVAYLMRGVPSVVAPMYYDDISHKELPSLTLSKYGVPSAMQRRTQQSTYPVDIVISSGTVATREAYERAGLLDESLFIDFVDTEWCFRCRDKEIPINVVPEVVMLHRIGSRSIDTGIVNVFVHSPERCYYQLRNCLLLFGKIHIPLFFSIYQFFTVLVNRLLLLFFVKNRINYLKAYAAAFRDGITGVSGPNPRKIQT